MATTSESDDESISSNIDTGPSADGPIQHEMRRRAFLITLAAAGATAAGAGQVSARSSPELNAESDLSPIPRASETVSIEGVDPAGDPLAFIEDDGTESSLANYGGEVASAPTNEDDETQPHNPFSLRADYLKTDEYSAFPRGETYDDGEDSDAPVSALDATHWSTTAAEAAVADVTPASGGPGLEFSTDGLADGSTVGIEFTKVDITDGVSRKELQLVLSISALGGTAEVRVGDGTTWATATIDSAADADADGTIATATGDGIVYQAKVGDLDDTLDEISTVQIRAHDGDATIEVAGLNVERESSWSFGEREVWDTSDEEEIVTEEFVEPVGEFSIADLETLDDVFSGGEINPISVDVEYYPTTTEYETGDPSNPAYDSGLQIVDNIEIPAAYDLSHGSISVDLEVGLSPDQWATLEAVSELSETIAIEDVDDESFTDYSGNLDSVETGDDVGVGSATAGKIVGVHQEVDVLEDQLDTIESSGAVAGGPFGGGGGGGFFSSALGIFATIGSGIATYLAISRGWLARLLGA